MVNDVEASSQFRAKIVKKGMQQTTFVIFFENMFFYELKSNEKNLLFFVALFFNKSII